MTTRTTIPFQLHDTAGEVTTEYGFNSDPREVGFDLLGLNMVDVARGFPVLEARVQYEGAGYKSYMGWIHVLSMKENDETERRIVDIPPQLENTGSPFIAWGPTPTFFDAPATTATQMSWTANAFLVASPIPLVAIEWGYNVADGNIVPAPLSTPDVKAAWRRALPVLRTYDSWQFTDH